MTSRIPQVAHLTREEWLALGFDVGVRFRVLEGYAAGERGIIVDIKQFTSPVFGRPGEVRHTTVADTRLGEQPYGISCFYNPALLEIEQ